MTLRATIEIVPYGDETLSEKLYRIDVSNTGLIREEGFGHQICSYSVRVYHHHNPTMRDLLKTKEWELEYERTIPEHDRRDGALELIEKAIRSIEDGSD